MALVLRAVLLAGVSLVEFLADRLRYTAIAAGSMSGDCHKLALGRASAGHVDEALRAAT